MCGVRGTHYYSWTSIRKNQLINIYEITLPIAVANILPFLEPLRRTNTANCWSVSTVVHAQEEYTDQLLTKYLLRKDRGRFISGGLSQPFTNFRGFQPPAPAPLFLCQWWCTVVFHTLFTHCTCGLSYIRLRQYFRFSCSSQNTPTQARKDMCAGQLCYHHRDHEEAL